MDASKILSLTLLASVGLNIYLVSRMTCHTAGQSSYNFNSRQSENARLSEPSVHPESQIAPNLQGEENSPELIKALADARVVPYFRNGESIGMRLFAIVRGGVFDVPDLQNGDIILKINDQQIKDPTNLMQLLKRFVQKEPLTLEIERMGQVKKIQVNPSTN